MKTVGGDRVGGRENRLRGRWEQEDGGGSKSSKCESKGSRISRRK